MDKKTEIALGAGLGSGRHNRTTSTRQRARWPARQLGRANSTGWWMYHGDPDHTGYVSDSPSPLTMSKPTPAR